MAGAIIGATEGYIIGRQVGATGWNLFAYVMAGAGIGAYSGFVGGTIGAGVAIAIKGGMGTVAISVISGAAGGAAAGAISGAGMTALRGGNIGEVAKGALIGAGAGAVGGAISGGIMGGFANSSPVGKWVGYGLAGLSGGGAAGFIGGYAQKGKLEDGLEGAMWGAGAGLFGGLVAGGIGYHKQMQIQKQFLSSLKSTYIRTKLFEDRRMKLATACNECDIYWENISWKKSYDAIRSFGILTPDAKLMMRKTFSIFQNPDYVYNKLTRPPLMNIEKFMNIPYNSTMNPDSQTYRTYHGIVTSPIK